MRLFNSNSLLLIHYLAPTRSLLLGMSGILFLKFLHACPPLPVYSVLYTWSHTVNFSPLCVFKRSYSCHHRGAHFGQVPIWNGTELVHKWNADRNLFMLPWAIKALCSAWVNIPPGGRSLFQLGTHRHLRGGALFRCPQWLSSKVHVSTISVTLTEKIISC